MTAENYKTCDKCKQVRRSVKEINVAAAEDQKINLCAVCQVNLLEWMFDWDCTSDCIETCNSLYSFMSYNDEKL